MKLSLYWASMKSSKLILSAAIAFSAILGIGPGSAADLPVKALPPAVTAFSWTGFYVGGNVGYSWGNSNNDWSVLNPIFPGGSLSCGPAASIGVCAANDSNRLKGVIGGVQAGYNWQTANFVFGIETDIQASGQKGSQLFSATIPIPIFAPFDRSSATAQYTEKLLWFGTLRGRAGVTIDKLLVYATGGLAYGEVSTDGSMTTSGGNANGFPPNCPPGGFVPGCALAGWSNHVTRAGWTIGAGFEYAIAATGWSWKVEYLHVDLGRATTTFPTNATCFAALGSPGCTVTSAGIGSIRSGITDDIVRIGINYKIGWGNALVVARY
jgi:outer membrane immunogenic protein